MFKINDQWENDHDEEYSYLKKSLVERVKLAHQAIS